MLRKTLSSFLALWIIVSPFANALMKNAEAAPTVGAPTFSPSALTAGVPTEIAVSARILKGPTDPAIVSTGVNLLRVDANGAVLGIVGTMKDDGTSGDPTGNDRTFTLRFTVTATAGETIRLRASVPFRGFAQRVLSPIATIPVQIAQNLPPNFTSTPPAAGTVGVAYNYPAAAQDPENSALTFQLVSGPSGMALNQTSGLVQWTPAGNQTGPQSVSLRVLDGAGASALQNFTIQVAAPQNLPPAFTSVAATAATVGTLYSYQATAQDPENGALTYQVVSGPSGLVIGPTTGLVQWTPGSGDLGPQNVQLRVSDPQNASGTQSFTIQTNPTGTNLPPVITSTPITTATTTVTYTYQVAAQDPEGGALTYQLVSGPAGLTIGATGFVQWIPSTTQVGDHNVQLRVADAQGASTPQNFSIRVTELNLAPIITSVPTTFAKTTEQYRYDLTAYDPEKRSVAFSFAQAQPAGMTIDTATGAVRWNPTNGQIGNVTVSVRATDPAGAFDTQTFSVKVFDPANDLQITSPNGPQTIRIGQTLTLPLQSNYTGAVFSINPSLTNGSIAGTNFSFKPTSDQEGVQTVTFKAVYGDMQKSVVIPITVTRDNSAPAITPIGQQTVQEGNSLNFTVSATDAENDALTYSAPALNIANAFFSTFSRQFTFNPIVGQAGSYTATFVVSDGRATSQLTVPITVTKNTGNQQILNLVVDPPTSPTFQTSANITGNVTGQAGIPPPKQNPPLVTGLVPSVAKQGQMLNVQLTGLNTAFAQATSRADFGDGIKVNSLTVSSPTSAQANITIDSLARLGTRTVRMVTAGGEAPAVVAFTVDKGVASITGLVIDPFTNQPLANARISINNTTIFGTTDNQGRFTLNNVPIGTVPLVITLPNYDVQRVTVAVGANETVDLEAPIKVNALARPPAFVGSIPRAASVASVLDRGVTAKGGGLTLDQAKAVIQDTMLTVGGIEAGVYDSAGNQLNSKVTGAGEFSLTQEGVEAHGRALLRGDVTTLRDFVNVLRLAFSIPGGISVETVVDGFQQAVNEAWANPSDPQFAMAIVLFNEGTTLSPKPPIVTRETRFNSFQRFLLTASFLTLNSGILDATIDTILKARGIDPKTIVPPPRFAKVPAPQETLLARLGIPKLFAEISDWLVPSAFALPPGFCTPQPDCETAELAKRKTFTKVWSAMKANLFAEAIHGAFIAGTFALVQAVAVEAILSFLLVGGISGGLVLPALLATVGMALLQGAAMVVMFKLVVGYGVARTAAAFEPPPPAGAGSSKDTNGNFIIKFDLIEEHIRVAASGANKLKKFAYHLYRVPDCKDPVDASLAEFVPLKAVPDITDPVNRHDQSKPYLGRHQFVVPSNLLKRGQNCFRIRAFQYLNNFETDLAQGIDAYDTNNDGNLDSTEFAQGGFGDAFTFGSADRNRDGRIDASEFHNFYTQKNAPPQDIQFAPGFPRSQLLRSHMGALNFASVGEYKARLDTMKLQIANIITTPLGPDPNSLAGLHQRLVDFHSPQAFFKYDGRFAPEIDLFLNNIKAFDLTAAATTAAELSGRQSRIDGVESVAQNISDTIFKQHLNRPATEVETSNLRDMVNAARLRSIAGDQLEFAGHAFHNIRDTKKSIDLAIEKGNVTKQSILLVTPTFPSAETMELGAQTFNAELTPENAAQVRRDLISFEAKAMVAMLDAGGRARDAGNQLRQLQQPLLNSALQTTSGLSSAEVETNFAAYFSKNKDHGVAGLELARQANGKVDELKAINNKIVERQMSAVPGELERPVEPELSSKQKIIRGGLSSSVDFLGFGLGVTQGLLTFVQSIQILSSDFSLSCFTTTPNLAARGTFPPSIEPFPGADEPHAVIRVDPDLTNPRNGLLTREYPGVSDDLTSVETGFPAAFLSIDNKNRLYALNLASIDQFGGRVFRYNFKPVSGTKRRGFTVTKRELVGAVNYKSPDLPIANPASPIAMVVGPPFQATAQNGSTVTTQDLFIANTDVQTGEKRILQLYTSQIDTIASFYTDSLGNEKNRHRIVGQPIVVNSEFRFTGPSDMEVGPDISLDRPQTTANSIIMFSDEDIIWAIARDSLSNFVARKVIQLPGRRWSGLAFDDQGKFYFADYASKEVFVMKFASFLQSTKQSIINEAPFISTEILLRELASRVTTLDVAPGDIEIEGFSTHPGGVLHVSTDFGTQPINLPVIAQVRDNVREINVKRFSKEEPVAIEPQTLFGTTVRTFRVVPSHEDIESSRMTLAVKRLNSDGQEYWQDEIIFLGAHGATILEFPLQ